MLLELFNVMLFASCNTFELWLPSQIWCYTTSKIKLDRMVCFAGFSIFFGHMTLSKMSKCATQITLKKKICLKYFMMNIFLINRHFLQYRSLNFSGSLSKFVGPNSHFPLSLSFLRGWDWHFEFGFSIKRWRIHLMRTCHILHILLSFIHF